jgi:hypothetical protein
VCSAEGGAQNETSARDSDRAHGGSGARRGLFASPAGAAPEAPNLIGPADVSTVTADPVLSWEPVATATRYKVQIATNPAFTSPVYDVTTYNTQATPPTDLAQVTHYWRVRGIDATNANGPYSATWSFDKTAGPAPVPLRARVHRRTSPCGRRAPISRWPRTSTGSRDGRSPTRSR